VRKAILCAILCVAATTSARSASPELTESAINSASIGGWSEGTSSKRPDPFLIRVQVLLDRTHVSPGVIDGYLGDNLTKAIRTFEPREGLEVDGKIDEKFWTALSNDNAPVMQNYQITSDDVSERYVEKVPTDYGEMSKIKWLGYTGPKEMLAERFHMDEALLELLNAHIAFTVGRKILVASRGNSASEKVSRIVVDRSDGELFAYQDDRLVVAYPATIGSTSNPSRRARTR
jgi:hypothetical protein